VEASSTQWRAPKENHPIYHNIEIFLPKTDNNHYLSDIKLMAPDSYVKFLGKKSFY
jgi:hypothetical protein